jgi:hypothetical protein
VTSDTFELSVHAAQLKIGFFVIKFCRLPIGKSVAIQAKITQLAAMPIVVARQAILLQAQETPCSMASPAFQSAMRPF